MADVIVFKGAVSYPITMDPSVWIFDERKIDLQAYQGEELQDMWDVNEYLEGTGSQWDKELKEGSTPPSERKSISMVEQRKALEGDYAMRLAYFIENAQPRANVTAMRILRESGEHVTLSLADAKRALLQFAKGGKPIREGGPALLYLPETWREKGPAIDHIVAFEFISSEDEEEVTPI